MVVAFSRPKRRRGGIDTALRASNIETRQSRTPLLNASFGDLPRRFYWIESESQRGHGPIHAQALGRLNLSLPPTTIKSTLARITVKHAK